MRNKPAALRPSPLGILLFPFWVVLQLVSAVANAWRRALCVHPPTKALAYPTFVDGGTVPRFICRCSACGAEVTL